MALRRASADGADAPVARDIATTGLDAAFDPMLIDADPMQDLFREALERISDNLYSKELDVSEILNRLESFSPEQVQGLMNNVQGTVLELRVQEAFDAGSFSFPEGAVRGEIADRTATALDGYFFDENGSVVDVFQVKASSDVSVVRSHLDRHPDIETVLITDSLSEAAQAQGTENVLPTRFELSDVIAPDADAFLDELTTTLSEHALEFVTGTIPVATLAMPESSPGHGRTEVNSGPWQLQCELAAQDDDRGVANRGLRRVRTQLGRRSSAEATSAFVAVSRRILVRWRHEASPR